MTDTRTSNERASDFQLRYLREVGKGGKRLDSQVVAGWLLEAICTELLERRATLEPKLAYHETHEAPHCPTCECGAAHEPCDCGYATCFKCYPGETAVAPSAVPECCGICGRGMVLQWRCDRCGINRSAVPPSQPPFPSLAAQWISVTERMPEPEVLVLVWDGSKTFVTWFGSLRDAGCGATHWIPYPMPPGATSDMHDGRRAVSTNF